MRVALADRVPGSKFQGWDFSKNVGTTFLYREAVVFHSPVSCTRAIWVMVEPVVVGRAINKTPI